jgi:DNA mismatch repair protein MutL
MIAAGEVIERPASVVKELSENSIDAGATQITIAVEDGGRKLISVADNGCGMDAEDLALAFQPHTTSKIKTEKDLHNIATLGFRGEALASIASVALVKAVSRMKDSLSGNCIDIDCGSSSEVRPCSADFGTKIDVRDIFYKMPARRKFLKTANTELEHISELFTRVALASSPPLGETSPKASQLDMTLISNDRQLYKLKAGQSPRQRIAELFSNDIADSLIETEFEDKKTGLHIYALLGKPAISRTNNKLQYIFLNGRFIRDKFISHAIKEAYRGCIDESRFPVVFLFISMPYLDYDVNVHPTKIEVRFFNPNLVHSEVLAAIREKLLAVDRGVDVKLPSPQGQKINEALADFFKKYRASSPQQLGFQPSAARHPAEKTAAYETAYGRKNIAYQSSLPERKFIQMHDCFIVTETDEGFCIIDQHALHERIMYENLCSRLDVGALESQKLLIPESFEVSAAQSQVLNDNSDLIEKLGIEIVPFGPKTFAVQAFPVILARASPLDFVRDLADLLVDMGKNTDKQKLLDEVLNMAACKAAIKAGQKLSDNEIEQLLADGEKLQRSGRCPHGRPTMIKFSKTELEKQFKRT